MYTSLTMVVFTGIWDRFAAVVASATSVSYTNVGSDGVSKGRLNTTLFSSVTGSLNPLATIPSRAVWSMPPSTHVIPAYSALVELPPNDPDI